jgi:hypothetical protein
MSRSKVTPIFKLTLTVIYIFFYFQLKKVPENKPKAHHCLHFARDYYPVSFSLIFDKEEHY